MVRRGDLVERALPSPEGRVGVDVHPPERRHLRRDVARLADLAGEVGADAVQVHGVQNPQAAFAARRLGAAVAWQLLDTRAPMPLRRVCMPMVTRMSDSVSSWGVAVAEGHPGARRLGDRLVTVYPPVDAAAFAPDEGARRRARPQGPSGERRPAGSSSTLRT